jgi:hypothetical protein
MPRVIEATDEGARRWDAVCMSGARRVAAMRSSLICLGAGLLACDPYAPPSYAGEPLATLHGRLYDSIDMPVDEAELLALWIGAALDPSTGCLEGQAYVERIGSTTDAAGQVTIVFHTLPPPDLAGGWIVSPLGLWVLFETFGAELVPGVEPGLDQDDVAQIDAELRDVAVASILGVAGASDDLPRRVDAEDFTDGSIAQTVFGEADVFVLYFPEALGAETWVARLMGHAIAPGFVFLRAEDSTQEDEAAAERAAQCLMDAADAPARFECSAQRFRELFAEIGPDDTARISLGDRPPPESSDPSEPSCG